MEAGTHLLLLILSLFFIHGGSASRCRAREQFECRLDGECISMKKWQDGVADCYDASDEVCLPWQFDCQFGSPRCVSKNKLNDAKIDCYSGFDEACPAHFFVCRDRSACIDPIKYLDGNADCADRSDEPCAQNEFQCADGSACIPRTRFQDGKEDCRDGSDEECTTSQFACPCGAVRCVAEKFIMDGSWDCEDGSDEFLNHTVPVNCTSRRNAGNTGINTLSLGKIKYCSSSVDQCKPELGQVCVVIGGTWRCVCKLGTVRPMGSDRCVPVELLARFRNSTNNSNCSSSAERRWTVETAKEVKQFGILKEVARKQSDRWSNVRRAPPRSMVVSGQTPNGIDGFLESGTERVPFMFQETAADDYVSAIPADVIDSYGTIETPSATSRLHFSRDEPSSTSSSRCGIGGCGRLEVCERSGPNATYECVCQKGFVKVDGKCEELLDECYLGQHDCHSAARCVDALVGYECLCREGYLDTSPDPKTRPGRSCEKLINECTNATLNDCSRNARCLDKPIGYTCRCNDNYVDVSSQGARKPGRKCTEAINECALNQHKCGAHAICQDLPIGYSCRCPFGFVDLSVGDEPGRKCVKGGQEVRGGVTWHWCDVAPLK